MRYVLLLAYLSCVPLANWLIGHVGTACIPHGPCLVPVAPGVMAPSGVLVIGAALVLRDLVQRTSGKAWSVVAVAIGAAMSWLVADPHIALASAAAFLISELADFGVYTPLQRRGLILAVVASASVGLVIDSAVFLWAAFGSLDYIAGQIVGKVWAVLISVPLIAGARKAFPTAPAAPRGQMELL
jgi:uncharacterized PurR-regulated membrane protein YhhQ (DUF165 family)